MRKLAVFLASLCLSTSLLAAPPTEASIDKLLAVTRVEKLMDAMYAQMELVMRQTLANVTKGETLSAEQQKAMEATSRKFVKVMREELSWASIRALYLQIYQETFTQEEIDGLIAFYESPAGKAYVDKMPIVMQKSMGSMQGRMAGMMGRMKVAIEEAAKEARIGKK